MRLEHARWPEVAAAARQVLVLPLGATEQHGPHLPLDTDTVIARAISQRLIEQRPTAGLAPAIPVGASGEHADFPGTLSIGTAALTGLLVEFLRHARRDWAAVLIVNGHGGNADALHAAAATARAENQVVGAVHLGLPEMDAHAGYAETSLMLHFDPQRVGLAAAAAGARAPVAELLPELRCRGVRAVSPNGVLGDPSGATAAAGARLAEALTAKALRAYDAVAARIAATAATPPATDG